MSGDLQTNRAHRRAEHRILIDRPIDAVWKRACDLRAVGGSLERLQVRDAAPNGDTVRAQAWITLAPLRLQLVGTAAVVDIDDLAHRATVRAHARDRGGRGKLTATAEIAMRPVGSGTEVDLVLDVEAAGAVVRATGSALLDELDAFIRAYFVALAGDAFAIDPLEDETLFELHDDNSIALDFLALDLVALDDAAPDDALVDLTRFERAGLEPAGRDEPAAEPLADTQPAVGLFRAAAEPAVSFERFVRALQTAVLEPVADLGAHAVAMDEALPVVVVEDPVVVPTLVTPQLVAAARSSAPKAQPFVPRVGLPAASLPRARGISKFRSRAAKATQTAGSVAAGAAVVAAVAGAYAARRWLGRR